MPGHFIHTVKTPLGVLLQDLSYLWNYYPNEGVAEIDAAKDALSRWPEGCATWFWFNGTPARMEVGDNMFSLIKRHEEWAVTWKKTAGPRLFFEQFDSHPYLS